MIKNTAVRLGTLIAAAAVIVSGTACHAVAATTTATPARTWGAIGDSITYGLGTSDPATKAYPVVAGAAGRGFAGQCLVATTCFWQPLVSSFPTELAYLHDTAGVDAVVVEIGINDLSQNVTDQAYIDAFHRLKLEGRARGVRVILSTITPRAAAHPFTADQDAQRERVNTWIRGHVSYVDYAAALGGNVMLPEYDSGDGLHPNDQGAVEMGNTLAAWIAAGQASTVKRHPVAARVCVRAPCSAKPGNREEWRA